VALLLILIVLDLLAIPVAVLLSLAGIRPEGRQKGKGPWCASCGYSLAGLAAGSACPECNTPPQTVTRTQPWPAGLVATFCCAAGYLPGMVIFQVRDEASGFLLRLAAAAIIAGIVTLSVIAVCVVNRRGTRWLTLATIALFTLVPFGTEIVLAAAEEGGSKDELGRLLSGFAILATPPIAAVFTFAAFTVAGLLTALVLHLRRPATDNA
jgi:Na+/melibiose symporter-like transporter